MSQEYLTFLEMMRISFTATSMPTGLVFYEEYKDEVTVTGVVETGEANIILCYLQYFLQELGGILDDLEIEKEDYPEDSLERLNVEKQSEYVEKQANGIWENILNVAKELFQIDTENILDTAISETYKFLVFYQEEEKVSGKPNTESVNNDVDNDPLPDPLDFSHNYPYIPNSKLN